jgi:anti-sigma B factor antagonist
MSIKVTCPNGHDLQVKSEFAGKSGLCPHCKVRIEVPTPATETVSEDELLAVLGQPRKAHRHAASGDEPRGPHQVAQTGQAAPKKEAERPTDDRPRSAASLRRTRVCPKCCEFLSVSHTHCPKCRTPLSEWTFPVPDTAHGNEKAMCHYLGVRNRNGVFVIRFGEHKILDEMTIKKFGDELLRVADREDCRHLLLNFVGVVGFSSVMLGILLMLRKKMSLKPGTIKLCQVGPEIMDVFHATKLGQLFEIVNDEQEAIKAFA